MMRQSSCLRRFLPAIAIVILTLFAGACASTNKYGCPNKIASVLPLK